MIAIDTNVLLRYIVKDDVEQASVAVTFIEQNHCVLLHTVLLETVWVLSSKHGYHLSKTLIVQELRDFIGLPNVFTQDDEVVAESLSLYEQGMDFADILHFKTAANLQGFATFDRRMRNKVKLLNLQQPLVFLGTESH